MNPRLLLPLFFLAGTALHAATEIRSNGVVWTLSADRPAGTFVSGDPWVVGPVSVTSITNTLNDPSFTPKTGQNGSMVNPGTTDKQGYDSGLQNYDPALNAALPDGEPVSSAKPLNLPAGATLVSAVSWLYRSDTDAEPGIPNFNRGAKTPRPVLRSAGILTVLDKAPPADAFRPPYCGSDKTIRFHTAQLDYAKLPALAVPPDAKAPALSRMADAFSKPWLDHVHEWMGDWTHPSEHMPHYGRDMARLVGDATLALFLDASPRGANPDKDRLITGLVQYGIDLDGIAANGGGWPANGGMSLGRKWPILFAGVLLNDSRMLSISQSGTRFQEDEQTFFISQAEVDLTKSPGWNPDKRAPRKAYVTADIGTPEWGIRHQANPELDNAEWTSPYRDVNGCVIPAFALSARLMHLEKAWNHEAFFAYCDRYMRIRRDYPKTVNQPTKFFVSMWETYGATPAP